MKKFLGIMVLGLLFFMNSTSSAEAKCIKWIGSDICSPPGGEIRIHYNRPVCGFGQCVRWMGKIVCSRVSMGSVVGFGEYASQPRCQGGCEEAQKKYCEDLGP